LVCEIVGHRKKRAESRRGAFHPYETAGHGDYSRFESDRLRVLTEQRSNKPVRNRAMLSLNASMQLQKEHDREPARGK
jgi:hypothetical protein